MKILALDFSSTQRSAAVVTQDSGNALTVSEVVETGAGAMRPLAMVETALREAKLEREQLECLAIGLGPGSYTGIRIAISLAQGWHLARDVRLIGISSVDAIIAQAQTEGLSGNVAVAIDAQRNELYIAEYEISSNKRQVIVPLKLTSLAEVNRGKKGMAWIGPEVTRWFPEGRVLHPRAAIIGQLASQSPRYVPGDKLEPIYLREAGFVKASPPRAHIT